jgi:hypothetical protein
MAKREVFFGEKHVLHEQQREHKRRALELEQLWRENSKAYLEIEY